MILFCLFVPITMLLRLHFPSKRTGELLSVMCDPRKMSGETGYYLASFHAALTHIHELDLTENDSDLSIIFDT